MTETKQNKAKLFIFDCDSTIIQDEVIDLLAKAAGAEEKVAAITEQAMRGELDFKQSLQERVKALKGLPETVFQDVIASVRLTPGVEELFNKIHAEGGYIGIVSGGFHEVLDTLAKNLKADYWMANRLEIRDGFLTGKTVGTVVDGEMKAQMLNEWARELKIAKPETVAVGDGANDIPMMQEAGLSVAFNAKPIVREHATHAIEHDLSKVIEIVFSH